MGLPISTALHHRTNFSYPSLDALLACESSFSSSVSVFSSTIIIMTPAGYGTVG